MIDLTHRLEQDLFAEVLRPGEAARFGAVEQGDQLAASEFFKAEPGSDAARWGRCTRCCIDGEVDEQFLGSGDDEVSRAVGTVLPLFV